jgi:hypothetical protein
LTRPWASELDSWPYLESQANWTDKAILGFVDQDGEFTQIAKINADELRHAADIFLELADTLESRDESDEEEEDEGWGGMKLGGKLSVSVVSCRWGVDQLLVSQDWLVRFRKSYILLLISRSSWATPSTDWRTRPIVVKERRLTMLFTED